MVLAGKNWNEHIKSNVKGMARIYDVVMSSI